MAYRPHTQSGLSLVEMMVSITISLLLVIGLVSLVSNTNQNFQDLTRASQQLENGRYAWHLLREELRLSGFYGELAELPDPAAALPDPCDNTAAVQTVGLSFPIQGYDAPAGSPLGCVNDFRPNTDILVIRRTSTVTATPNDANQFYVQSTPRSQVLAAGVAGWTVGTAPFNLEWTAYDPAVEINDPNSAAFDPALPANFPPPARAYFDYIYFIAQNSTAGDGIPTLKRVEVGPTGNTTVALVEGVENLQIVYGIDTNDNGAPDIFVTDTGAITAEQWNDVVAVELHLLVRNLEVSGGYKDEKTYNLGGTVVGPFNDAFKRHVYTAAVRLNNPAGRRE